MREIDKFFEEKEEPVKGCLWALRSLILNYEPLLALTWRYRLPCFLLNGQTFCYLWVDKKSQHPYIAIGKGVNIEHPALIQGKRTFVKLLMINPEGDIPLETIHDIFDKAMALYKL